MCLKCAKQSDGVFVYARVCISVCVGMRGCLGILVHGFLRARLSACVYFQAAFVCVCACAARGLN